MAWRSLNSVRPVNTHNVTLNHPMAMGRFSEGVSYIAQGHVSSLRGDQHRTAMVSAFAFPYHQ